MSPGFNPPNFKDRNFARMAEEVEAISRTRELEFDRKSPESMLRYDEALKRKEKDCVNLEFLARQLFLLFLFKKNPQLKPEVFFREQMNSGPRIIRQFVTV